MTSTVRSDSLTVRVGLLEDYDKLTFQMHGSYAVETLLGERVREARPSAVKWRARVDEAVPAQFLFSVLVGSFPSRDEAHALAESFESGRHARRGPPDRRPDRSRAAASSATTRFTACSSATSAPRPTPSR